MEVLGVFLFLLKSVKAGAVGALCITCSLTCGRTVEYGIYVFLK